MGYYNYHGMIRKRIENGELIKIVPAEKAGYAVIFVFKTFPFERPIKWEALYRYEGIIGVFSDQ